MEFHDYRPPTDAKPVRKLLSKMGAENYPELLELKRADCRAQNPELLEGKLVYIDTLEEICKKETEGGRKFRVSDLAVNGRDLMEIGISEGKKIGKTLEYLLSGMINEEIENDFDSMIKAARNFNNITDREETNGV